MPKYQVVIDFEMDEAFMSYVPEHRVLIDKLITNGTIDYYTVSMDSMQSWIVFNANTKQEVKTILKKSPLNKYWTMTINELFVYDSISYRLPEVSLN